MPRVVAKRLAASAAAFVIVSSGCAMVGGSKLVTVRGALPASAGECRLDFVVAGTGRVKMTQPASGDFVARVVVSSGIAQHYYFLARCEDQRSYRSEGAKIDMSDDEVEITLSAIDEGSG